MRKAGSRWLLYAIMALCSVLAAAEVTVSSNPALVGQPVIFTVNVDVPADITAIPTGTVTLMDGGVAIATEPVQNGAASFTTQFAAPGDHSITAAYSGDHNFQPTNSVPLLERVTAADAFTIAVSPSSLNQHSGSASDVAVTLFANNTTSQAVQLSCENLPPGTSCSFQTNTVRPVPGGTSTMMTITSEGSHISKSRSASGTWAAAFIFPLALGGFLGTSARSQQFRSFLSAAVCVAAIMCLSGCRDTLKVIQGGTPPGSYTINLVGSDGTLTQTAKIQLRIS
jgi:hypothetical protein